MKHAIKLTNEYIMLIPIFIIYSMLSGMFIVLSNKNGFLNILFSLFLFFMMTSAFVSGWFNVIKKIITFKENETANSILKYFPEGVGKYFLSTCGAVLNIIILFVILLKIATLIGMHYIGDPKVSFEAITKALSNPLELKIFIQSLSLDQIVKIRYWNLLLLGYFFISHLLTFLYIPALFFKDKNPFKALWISLKDLFSKKFLKTVKLFLFIIIINIMISLCATIFSANSVLNTIVTCVNFYFLTVISFMIFDYYNNEFNEQKIGQNIDLIL